MSSGNQPRTNSTHSARDNGAPPGASPAASAGATYLRTVPRSTLTLAATSALDRPACQCCRTSTTSITSNALLAITPRSSSDEPGAYVDKEPSWWTPAAPHHPQSGGLRERRDDGLRERHPQHAVDYLNADTLRRVERRRHGSTLRKGCRRV